MSENTGSTWRRNFNRYVPLVVVITGLILILSNLAIADAPTGLYARVLGGIVLVMVGYLYGSHPFLTSERRYTRLRGEVDNFMTLVRELNRTAVAIGGGPELNEVTAALRNSLARIEELAGKES